MTELRRNSSRICRTVSAGAPFAPENRSTFVRPVSVRVVVSGPSRSIDIRSSPVKNA